MNLETSVAGIQLEHPIMNAAGPNCKTPEEIAELAKSPTSAVTGGSYTEDSRQGNSGEVYFSTEVFSLNSLGLPNSGRLACAQFLPEVVENVHAQGKPFVFSAAGFTPEEYQNLATTASEAGVDLIELNFGCPNVWDKGEQKRITSFDPAVIQNILRRITESLVYSESKVAVKLSPFSDPVALSEVASVIADFPVVRAVTTANTFPNAFALNEHGNSAISPEFSDGLAGLAGPVLKPIVLGQIKQLRKVLPEYVDIIGVGGISTGRDVWEYRQVGADAVQIATAYANRRTRVFGDILTQYINILDAEEMVSV